ncbi:MAG: hypothetical protein H7Y01_07995 [Ferruginibacter sp.]|nr:hypothetical protein [Chitinophagaceae bacterium]
MLLRQSDNYIKVCMNTWLLCEACIHTEKERLYPKQKLLQACHQCSEACLSLVTIFISNPLTVQQHVFDCFLYCRECYNECMLYKDDDIEYCGMICDKCAESMKELLFFSLN